MREQPLGHNCTSHQQQYLSLADSGVVDPYGQRLLILPVITQHTISSLVNDPDSERSVAKLHFCYRTVAQLLLHVVSLVL